MRDWAHSLENLERDIPQDLSKDEREGWEVLSGTLPEIREEILKKHDKIISRAQVIAAG